MVVLVPARGGSKRLPNKALRDLGGKPLIRWTVDSCLEAARYRADLTVVVASESKAILAAVDDCNVDTWERPLSTASDDAPDLTWLSLALTRWPDEALFVVRRPTSPFISLDTLLRALEDFSQVPEATAMRAMRPVREHPGKIWERRGCWVEPFLVDTHLLRGIRAIEPWSMPTQQLSTVYVQTAGLELIRRSTLEAGSLTGNRVLPLFLEGAEALDLNTEDDWREAERLVGEA